MLRKLINSQIWLSRKFDNFLPSKYRVDGNKDYINSFVPQYLRNGLTIYDIGGGKGPYLSVERKQLLNATVIGIDVDREELNKAPQGSYDEAIVSDISQYRGDGQADLLVCQAVLEHVRDVESAFEAMASILKPGGIALIFVPSRNALFARLNIILPQKIKESILYAIFPKTREAQGFPSFYDKCTPIKFRELASNNGLSIVEERYYYISSYFSFFFPAYLAWRFWMMLFYLVSKEQAAETFSLALRKEKYL